MAKKSSKVQWIIDLFTNQRKSFSEQTSCMFEDTDTSMGLELTLSGSVSKTQLLYDLIYPYLFSTSAAMLRGRDFKIDCTTVSERDDGATNVRISVKVAKDDPESRKVIKDVFTQIQHYAVTRLATSSREGLSGLGTAESLSCPKTLADKDTFDDFSFPDLAVAKA